MWLIREKECLFISEFLITWAKPGCFYLNYENMQNMVDGVSNEALIEFKTNG